MEPGTKVPCSGLDCPDENQLAAFLANRLSAAEEQATELHLDGCAACRALLAQHARLFSPPHEEDVELEPGAEVGRYLVREQVGAGGMGVVFAAEDTVLKRKVALKVMRPGVSASHRARLEREAEALARLAHPNVVAIHDLGRWHGRIYLAMELVQGRTLTEWLRQQPRPRDAVLRVFLEAGRGLAAAHAAGLVHRDFKPANVLIGDDGRARVVDFGLARDVRESGDAGPPAGARFLPDATGPTLTGTLLGTPAYMAPEQRSGIGADARSDQWAFALTLYEALSGDRPSGDRPDQAAAKDRRVPPVLRRALERALSPDPGARFPALDALLAQLIRALPARRRTRALLAVASAALAIGLAVGGTQAYRRQLCRNAGAGAKRSWNDGRRGELRRAFLATGLPFAQTELDSTTRRLDAYAAAWADAATEACAATRLRGEQTEDLWIRKKDCLERRALGLQALVALLATADAAAVEHASQAVDQLDDLSACADVPALLATDAESDPERRARREPVAAHLARAEALERAGKLRDGLPVARSVVGEAEALGPSPLRTDALYALGRLLHQAGESNESEEVLRKAAVAAESSRQDVQLARIWLDLAVLTGDQMGKPEQGQQWIALAEAVVTRQGRPARLEGELHHAKGVLAAAASRHPDAVLEYRAALPLLEHALGAHDTQVRNLLQNLGWSEYYAGHRDEALALFTRDLALFQEDEGVTHPLYGAALLGRGSVFADLGKFAEARRDFEAGGEILRQAWGPDTVALAMAVYDVGLVDVAEDHWPDADRRLAQAMEVLTRKLGPKHPQTVQTAQLICETLLDKAQSARARPYCQAVFDASPSAPAPIDLALCDLALGHPKDALRWLDAAAPDDPPLMQGRVLLARAQARWALGKDPGVPKLLADARRALQSAGADGEKPLAELEAWDASRRPKR